MADWVRAVFIGVTAASLDINTVSTLTLQARTNLLGTSLSDLTTHDDPPQRDPPQRDPFASYCHSQLTFNTNHTERTKRDSPQTPMYLAVLCQASWQDRPLSDARPSVGRTRRFRTAEPGWRWRCKRDGENQGGAEGAEDPREVKIREEG